jgi:hypothetical protein
VAQLQSAPVAAEGLDAGECVDPKWESAHGHAHASLRYGAMSRPGVSKPPPEPSPRDLLFRAGLDGTEYLRADRMVRHIEQIDDPRPRRRLYTHP